MEQHINQVTGEPWRDPMKHQPGRPGDIRYVVAVVATLLVIGFILGPILGPILRWAQV